MSKTNPRLDPTAAGAAASADPAQRAASPLTGAAAHPPVDAWGFVAGSAAAATVLGHALWISGGTYSPSALGWLTVALILALLAVAAPRRPQWERAARRGLFTLLGAALIWHLVDLTTAYPGIYLKSLRFTELRPFYALVVSAGVLAAAGLSREPWLGRWRFPLLLAVVFATGAWVLNASFEPGIDVFVYQQLSSQALLEGVNPYAITFPDIYGNASQYFGPGIAVDGQLLFGYPYQPLSLLLAVPGYVFAGDHRFAQLAAVVASGALMAYARPGPLASMAAALFLLTPATFRVLESGWTEPFVVLLLSATVFAGCRSPRLTPWAFGLFVAVKQYLVLAVPLAVLLVPPPARLGRVWRLLWRAGALAIVITVPFVLWDVRAYLHSAVTLQALQPFRLDSLSYLAWVEGGPRPSTGAAAGAPLIAMPGGAARGTAALVGAVAAGALALWRCQRTPAGFAAAVAVTFFAFFALNKQAFLNYYYFVTGALWCAAAAAQPPIATKAAAPAGPPPAPSNADLHETML